MTSLQPITMTDLFYTVSTTPLLDGGSAVSSNTLFVPKFGRDDSSGMTTTAATTMNDVVCFVGKADGLPDADVLSAYGGVDGTDCTSPNGCGVHVRSFVPLFCYASGVILL